MKYFDALAAALMIGLASVGLWRVIAVDTLTKPIRAKIFNETRDEANGRLYSWLKLWYKCAWCAGAWITAAITIATDLTVGLPMPLLVFAAARYVTGWIGSNDKDYQEQMMRGEP
jgi:uncharacterized membrane protein YjgN (DUF898 family)